MTAFGGEPAASPAAILKSTRPPDDAGASTTDRYDWQAAMATADVLALYLGCLDADGTVSEGAGFEVICEHHEDWAMSDAQTAEIVSAKHRETGVGPYATFRSLLVDGGVLHLYERWLALDQATRCRLVTTAGLASDAHTLAELAAALAQGVPDGPEHDEVITKLMAALGRARALQAATGTAAPAAPAANDSVDGEERARLVEFLRILRIDHSRPSRDYVGLVAPGGYALPVAERLSAPEAAEAIWAAVHGLVRERMRAAGPRRRGHLPTVLGGADEPDFESRTVTLADIIVAVRIAVANQSGFGPLPRPIRTSRLAIKMTAGRCSDNAVARAEVLSRQYRQYWREVQATPTVVPTRRRVENVLLRVVDETTDVVRESDEPWGGSLWREVQVRLDDLAADGHGYGLDADLLLGGVSSLAGECVAWFSDAFDVDAAAEHAAQVSAAQAPQTTAASPVPAAPPPATPAPDPSARSIHSDSPGDPKGGQG